MQKADIAWLLDIFNHLISLSFLHLFNKYILTLLCAGHFARPGGDQNTHPDLKHPVLHLIILTSQLSICQKGLYAEAPGPSVPGHTQKSNTEKLYLSLAFSFTLSLQHYCEDMFFFARETRSKTEQGNSGT